MKTNTTFDASLLIVRAILSITIGAHGAQKLLGWFGGFGFEGTMGFFVNVIGLPYLFALLIILTESIGMVALLFGMASRFISVSLAVIMLGAIVSTHGPFGFFMNWFGTQSGEGFEFHLLVIGLSLVIALNGAGRFSIDAYIRQRLVQRKPISQVFFG